MKLILSLSLLFICIICKSQTLNRNRLLHSLRHEIVEQRIEKNLKLLQRRELRSQWRIQRKRKHQHKKQKEKFEKETSLTGHPLPGQRA